MNLVFIVLNRLLIVTQKVDKQDPILGFFHRWLEEFAKYFPQIICICLQAGNYDLPKDVKVLSLGKESGSSRGKYLRRFYKYIWQERKNYDTVFVHMNQEYVLLAGWLWRLWGKKVLLWRNHAKGGLLTRLSVRLSHKVFYTSPDSFTAQFAKAEQMPVGVDTDLFCPDPSVKPKPYSLLMLGRISPVKRIEIFINALLEWQKQGGKFTATIVGSPSSQADNFYESKLHRLAKPLTDVCVLSFRPGVAHNLTPDIYRSHEIYVNLTPTGSRDKTIFEAQACGSLTLVISSGVGRDLVSKFKELLSLNSRDRVTVLAHNLEFVKRNHSLKQLVARLIDLQ